MSGVAFGIVLGVSGYQVYMAMGCHYTAPAQVVRVETPSPQPCEATAVPVASSLTVIVQSDDEITAEEDDVDSRLSQAQTEYVNGNYKRSMALARSVMHESPTRAYRIIGSAGCNIGDLKAVNMAYRHVDAPGRQYLVYVCQRQGITLSGSRFIKH